MVWISSLQRAQSHHGLKTALFQKCETKGLQHGPFPVLLVKPQAAGLETLVGPIVRRASLQIQGKGRTARVHPYRNLASGAAQRYYSARVRALHAVHHCEMFRG